MKLSPKHILIVYAHSGSLETMRLAIRHHLKVLEVSDTKHEITYYNALNDAPPRDSVLSSIRTEIPSSLRRTDFDVVILHTTFLCYRWFGSYFYRWKKRFDWIGQLKCLKFAMPQDEYDHSEILDEWLFDWNVSVIFTCFGKQQQKLLYPIMHKRATFYEIFTGYIDETAVGQYKERILPLADRPNDIVYRASHLPFWFGSHGQLKHQIADIVANRARAQGLHVDISTRASDTILGEKWLDFLVSGRAIIGCESGSSVIDYRGEVQARIRALLNQDPTLSLEMVSDQMPHGWDDYQFFAISPRHFEAIGTKTCQILVDGQYNGVLEPNKHYLPLKRDFSNIDDILVQLKDYTYIQSIVEQAYEDIYLSGKYNYQSFARMIEQAIFDQEQNSESATRSSFTTMPDNPKALEILERELVTERHNNALLQAKLLEAQSIRGFLKTTFQNKRLLGFTITALMVLILINSIVVALIVLIALSLK